MHCGQGKAGIFQPWTHRGAAVVASGVGEGSPVVIEPARLNSAGGAVSAIPA